MDKLQRGVKVQVITINKVCLFWLMAAQLLTLLPLLVRLPLWFSLIAVITLVWRWQIALARFNFPNSMVKLLVSLLCLVILFFSYRYALGVESMVAFLVCTFALKLLELRRQQDGLIFVFIGFVTVATQLLFSQSVLSAFYAGLCCLVLINAWQFIYLGHKQHSGLKLKTSSLLLLQALPLMLVMFVVMPRLPPLWKANLFKSTGQTGFSETLSPGDLSSLVQGQGSAFRVQFEGAAPTLDKMYWRGLVLDEFDGRAWSLNESWQKPASVQTKHADINEIQNTYAYQVTLEAHQYQWLFSLEQLVKLDTGRLRVTQNQDALISSHSIISSRIQYDAISQLSNSFQQQLSDKQFLYLTRLPEGFNPRALELAKQWQKQGLSKQQLVDKALAWYEQVFYYTLQPPKLGEHSVDEFLFSSQRGFCEHYASSFVVLMRAAGIPARVVVGYLGGVKNPQQDYWIIRQANAHAWAEVWIDGQWLRVDPTHAVAPERVEQGIESALGSSEQALLTSGLLNSPDWLTQMRFQLDAFNYQWNRWVLSYDQDSQRQLFKKLLGSGATWRIGLVFIAILVSLIALLSYLVFRGQKEPLTKLQKALKQFDQRCLKLGVQRQQQESLTLFLKRLAKQQPQFKANCLQLARLSQSLLYANDSKQEADVREQNEAKLIHLLKQFPH